MRLRVSVAKVILFCYKSPHWQLTGQGSASVPAVCDTDWLQLAGNKYAHLWKSKVDVWNQTLLHIRCSCEHTVCSSVAGASLSSGLCSVYLHWWVCLEQVVQKRPGRLPIFFSHIFKLCSNISLPYRLPGIPPFLHQSLSPTLCLLLHLLFNPGSAPFLSFP